MSDWQPIETVPAFTEILLCGRCGDEPWRFSVGTYSDLPKTMGGRSMLWNWDWTFSPTHWMPLPEPPSDD